MAQDSGGTYLCILTKTEVMGWSQKNLWHDRKIKDSMEKGEILLIFSMKILLLFLAEMQKYLSKLHI